jgi:hypothetical protein
MKYLINITLIIIFVVNHVYSINSNKDIFYGSSLFNVSKGMDANRSELSNGDGTPILFFAPVDTQVSGGRLGRGWDWVKTISNYMKLCSMPPNVGIVINLKISLNRMEISGLGYHYCLFAIQCGFSIAVKNLIYNT